VGATSLPQHAKPGWSPHSPLSPSTDPQSALPMRASSQIVSVRSAPSNKVPGGNPHNT
jgi:hypothetical protein